MALHFKGLKPWSSHHPTQLKSTSTGQLGWVESARAMWSVNTLKPQFNSTKSRQFSVNRKVLNMFRTLRLTANWQPFCPVELSRVGSGRLSIPHINKHPTGCEAQLASRPSFLGGRFDSQTRSDWICFGVRSRFTSRYVHARLQVSVCSGYDLCNPGWSKNEFYILTPDLSKSTSNRGKSVSWCDQVRCTCGANFVTAGQ